MAWLSSSTKNNIRTNEMNYKIAKEANENNYRIAQEQNDWNYRMFQEQNQFNVDMWNAQNKYNSPLEQIKRFEEAGVNPYFALDALGNSSAGSVTSASAAPAAGAQYQAAHMEQNPAAGTEFAASLQALNSSIAQMQQLSQIQNQRKITDAQVNMLDAQAANYSATAEAQNFENNVSRVMNRWFEDRAKLRYNTEQEDWRSLYLNNKLARQSFNYNEDTFNDRVMQVQENRLLTAAQRAYTGEQVASQALETAMNRLRLENLPKELAAQLRESYARAWNSYATGRASLSQASAAMMVANQQVKNLVMQNGVTALEFDKMQQTFRSDVDKIISSNKAETAQYESDEIFRRSLWGRYADPVLRSLSAPAAMGAVMFGLGKFGSSATRQLNKPKFRYSTDGVNFKKVK